MASSATSLHFLSLSSQTLSLSKPNAAVFLPVSFSPSSLKPFLSISSSSSSPVGLFETTVSLCRSRFVRNVAVSSELGETEDLDEDVSQRNYSEDLKVFVGNLPFSVDSAALAELFEQAGNVEMVEVIYDKITGRSRGFGFVTMSTAKEAEAAARQFNGYELEGRSMRVNHGPAPPRRERENSSFGGSRGGGGGGGGGGYSGNNTNRLYVGNLAWGVDTQALETLFSEHGRVLDAKVVYDRESGRSRGFGFVTFGSTDEANKAINSLNGVDLSGRTIQVSPAESRTRSEF